VQDEHRYATLRLRNLDGPPISSSAQNYETTIDIKCLLQPPLKRHRTHALLALSTVRAAIRGGIPITNSGEWAGVNGVGGMQPNEDGQISKQGAATIVE